MAVYMFTYCTIRLSPNLDFYRVRTNVPDMDIPPYNEILIFDPYMRFTYLFHPNDDFRNHVREVALNRVWEEFIRGFLSHLFDRRQSAEASLGVPTRGFIPGGLRTLSRYREQIRTEIDHLESRYSEINNFLVDNDFYYNCEGPTRYVMPNPERNMSSEEVQRLNRQMYGLEYERRMYTRRIFNLFRLAMDLEKRIRDAGGSVNYIDGVQLLALQFEQRVKPHLSRLILRYTHIENINL